MNTGRCAYCDDEFDDYIENEREFCCADCDKRWWRESVEGYKDYEPDYTLYRNKFRKGYVDGGNKMETTDEGKLLDKLNRMLSEYRKLITLAKTYKVEK